MTLTAAGLDTSKDQLDLAVSTDRGPVQRFHVENTPTGHKKLIARLQRLGNTVRVCMEATGVYGLDVAVALSNTPGMEVMVLNPRTARRFAEALGVRTKTDPIDANCLLQFLQRMDFKPWTPPTEAALQLRALTRRMHQLTEHLVQEKNRKHAADSTDILRVLRPEIEHLIEVLEELIERIQRAAIKIVYQDQAMRTDFELLCSVPGIAQRSALKLIAELATMPKGLSVQELTAFAGLDPKIVESGSSVRALARISKRGNVYLRNALYMPAHNIARRDPYLKAFTERLKGRGKANMQAKVAVMRKLLLIINAMLRDKTAFEPRDLKFAA